MASPQEDQQPSQSSVQAVNAVSFMLHMQARITYIHTRSEVLRPEPLWPVKKQRFRPSLDAFHAPSMQREAAVSSVAEAAATAQLTNGLTSCVTGVCAGALS